VKPKRADIVEQVVDSMKVIKENSMIGKITDHAWREPEL
jgi:hypothetical protein